MNISDRLREAALLAREFDDTPLWQRENVREGSITIQQQAERFAAAADDAARADASTWAREGYQILSSALPDTHAGPRPDERKTGWATSDQISKLFGPEYLWLARIRLAYITSIVPDVSAHHPDSEYLQGLIDIAGISQRAAAKRIGISERMMRYYVAAEAADHRPAPYLVQYALERLAAAK